jgi:tetratricopeptide (TPR) repeat protein
MRARRFGAKLAESDPGNTDWQLDLSVAHENIGDMLIDIGNLAGALAAYEASLAIAAKLAESDLGNTDWQDRLSVARQDIGDVLLTQGKLEEALAAYEASLAIAAKLAKSDLGNADRQHGLSVAHENIGDVLLTQDKLVEALAAYEASLAIAAKLAKSDPDSSSWQRHLSSSHDKIGNSLVISGQLEKAVVAHRRSLEISKKIARMDPSNHESQVDLAEGLLLLVLTEAGTATRAPEQFRKTFANYIKLDLINNPDSICRRADLIRELFKLAKVGTEPRKRLTSGRDILHKQATASHQSARQKYLTVMIESALSPSADRGRLDPAHPRAELTCTQAASFARRRRVTVPDWRGDVLRR